MLPAQTGRRRIQLRRRGAVAGLTAGLLVVAACTGGGGQSSSGTNANATLTMASSSPWTTTQENPWSPNFVAAANDFVYMPLAVQDWPSLTKFTPRLATSWSIKGNQFTVNLRNGVKWQDGTTVTSTDVVDTMYLNGVAGGGIWSDISSVSAPTDTTVVLTARKGVPMAQVQADMLDGVVPRASSVYGKFVTAEVKQDVPAYFNQLATDPNGALKSTAFKNLESDLTKLTAFKPTKIVGDGPYQLQSVTTQEATLTKWDGYYDAKGITIGKISYLGAQQPQVNANLLTGRADISFAWLYMPSNIVQQWNKKPNTHLISIPGTFQAEVIYNDNESPFTQTAVRQALLYALPIKKADVLAWGSVQPHAIPPDIPDGLVSDIEKQYLTPSQIKALNPYDYNTTKAAQLLTGIGFKKVGNQWMLPNGKPWSITLKIDASWTDQVAAFKEMSSALNSFGIKTTFDAEEDASFQADVHKGNFDLAAYCCAGGDPNPIIDFAASPMGSVENFSSTGQDKGQRGIGFGPTANVPGIGTVNVPQTLDAQSHSFSPGPAMNQATYNWAKFVNTQVPYVEYADFANQIAYSDAKFTWPPETDPTWKLGDGNNNETIILGMQNGLIHPK